MINYCDCRRNIRFWEFSEDNSNLEVANFKGLFVGGLAIGVVFWLLLVGTAGV